LTDPLRTGSHIASRLQSCNDRISRLKEVAEVFPEVNQRRPWVISNTRGCRSSEIVDNRTDSMLDRNLQSKRGVKVAIRVLIEVLGPCSGVSDFAEEAIYQRLVASYYRSDRLDQLKRSVPDVFAQSAEPQLTAIPVVVI
jgi:hypothetical protein